ncbi:MAG TPA: zinc ribbon domain-containing protein [Verrucomicrobiota bacterium]|nr:FmdB family transcriptional regulator [Verrucomicrobiales bacterium]HRI16650.1 zinc ribbon domain-containing protein [Verrucomicrobiota bacterium]
MPTYEYTCQKCGHDFEFAQSMSAAPLTVCPKEVCPRRPWGKGKVKRGIGGGAGLIFKGSGFYITDYRSEGYKSAVKQESESAKPKSEPKAGDSKPSESKPATPTESKPKPKSESKPASDKK